MVGAGEGGTMVVVMVVTLVKGQLHVWSVVKQKLGMKSQDKKSCRGVNNVFWLNFLTSC